MDKEFADEMIIRFQKIFFGFALSRTASIQEAEDLASKIMLEAYTTLLRVDDVTNWEGYLYKIARNVYARTINESKRYDCVHMNSFEFTDEYDFTKKLEQSEDYKKLKQEIAFLGNQQRKIIVMHYFDQLKLKEIADRLEIPSGTVKWHLHDAKKQLKEGMKKVRKKGNLGINPIEFDNMGHCGCAGTMGDTKEFLNTKLRQNIAYAVYHEPKSIEKMAEELGVSRVFLDDEVHILEEYGFLDKVKVNQYQANIMIHCDTKEIMQKEFEIIKEASKEYCKQYATKVIESVFAKKDEWQSHIYIPEDDINYLLWAVIPYTFYRMVPDDDWNEIINSHYKVIRPDGGNYIAFASLKKDFEIKKEKPGQHYNICGDMMNHCGKVTPVASWQLSTDFDTREFGWRDNKFSDYASLYSFIKGDLPKEELYVETYKRLYDRGLIVNQNSVDRVNVVVVKSELCESGEMNPCCDYLKSILPNPPQSLLDYRREMKKRIFELKKDSYPKHMHKLLKEYYGNNIFHPVLVLDELLDSGVLKPLSESQRKGVMTIVSSDCLPNS